MRTYLFLLLMILSFTVSAQLDSLNKVTYREVYFDYDIATLAPAQREKIFNTLDTIGQNAIRKIVITGHTDSIGSDDYNVRLSKRRVDHVQQLFLSRGIAAGKVEANYLGESKPATINTDETGRARNRRVEIAIQYRQVTPAPDPAPTVISDIKKGRIYGVVTDAETGEPITNAILEITMGNIREQTRSDANGAYAFGFNNIRAFTIECSAEGYIYDSQSVIPVTAADSVRVDFQLQPIEVGTKFVAENIYFLPNLPEVVRTSIPEMDKLQRMLQQNPTVKIEIQGHVNWPSTYMEPITPAILQLSEDRARTVFEYLVANGISPNRMTFVGKGNTEMVIPDAVNMEEYKKNMRVEILIVEM